jgi:inner membrane protein
VFACWGVRDYEHRRAIAALQSRTYNGVGPLRASAYPYWVDPFRWHGVVETPVFFARANVDSLAPEVDPESRMQIQYKPEETPVTLAAKKTYLGQVYLSWAQYPVTETEQLESGRASYVVRFRDLRYAYPNLTGRATLGAMVLLDRDLQVVSEQFGMRNAGARNPEQK